MSETPLSIYRSLLAAGEIRPDPSQERAVEKLDRLAQALVHYRPRQRAGWKTWLGLKRRPEDPPCGLYLYGGVGRGKSMLMDVFYRTSPVARRHRRRVHFHAFMLEIHERLHAWRQRNRTANETDPLVRIGNEVARETWLLCFDEFQVTNVADAMILSRLFGTLFDHGVVVVATSNRPPGDLYRNGLQRDRFLPFIDLLKRRLEVFYLAGETDYRMDRLGEMDVYFTPADAEAEAALERSFHQLVEDPGETVSPEPTTLTTQGREVTVPRAARGVAWFTFDELCARPLGAADYLAIAREFHTVIVSGIPAMGPERRDLAARFVTLVDALYEHRVKLLCSAAAPPQELYPAGDGAFEFQRTASRLIEMQSAEYKALEHVTPDGPQSDGTPAGGPPDDD